MTPEEKRAYVIADNKLALNAGWDEEILGRGTEGAVGTRPRLRPVHHRLLDRRGRQPGGGARPRGARRSGRRHVASRGPCPLPSRRHLAAGAAPADLRRLPRSGNGCRTDGRRTGPDGLHRSALQRSHPGPCRRLRRHQAPGVRHGLGRDEPGGVHRLPRVRRFATWSDVQRRWLDPLHLHGLAPHGGGPGRRLGHLYANSRTSSCG